MLRPLPFLALLLLPAAAAAQEEHARWNGPRALELVARGRETRHALVEDTAFRSYRGEARGYVYFFLDRPDADERTLVKADQVALEIYWEAPERSSQRIVGRRDQKLLPTDIRYHLDHLTVVQDDFGDRIRLGNGDEVAEVLHPLAPGSEDVYDFSLTDSLTIDLGPSARRVRVYELSVRPKDPERPGFVGTVFLDRDRAAVVRMGFTFTPASYVDPYLDYIRISLDNALWLGRYWLPYRQEVELRREMPLLDFVTGSVIRGRYQIGGYEFNERIPPALLMMGPVSSAPPGERESFTFERGLFDDLEEEGLAPPPSFEEIRTHAVQALGRRYVSGLPPLRLHIGSTSDIVRYDRAEGVYVGAGVHARPLAGVSARLSGGYAIERGRPSASVELAASPDQPEPAFHAYWDELRDLGPMRGAPGFVNTLAAMMATVDYLDPWFARGIRTSLWGRRPGSPLRVGLRRERHVSASDVVSRPGGPTFRPVRTIEEGSVTALDLSATPPLPADGEVSLAASLARINGRTYGAGRLSAEWEGPRAPDRWSWSAELDAGALAGDAPAQELFLLGGRGTLPGHPYRSFVGERFWLARAALSRPLLAPWVGLTAFAAAGATYLGDRTHPAGWGAPADSGAPKVSAGAGLELAWNVLSLDLARGLGAGGGWELVVSVTERFRPWL